VKTATAIRQVDRRSFLGAMTGLAVRSGLGSQSAPRIRVRGFNHLGLSVSDPEDSIDFYQKLFGAPIQARHGQTALLRLGSGPQFLAIGRADGPSGISHLCLGVENFDADDLVEILERHGLRRAESASGGLSGGSLSIRVRPRGPEAGGSPDGTPHVYFGDPDGIVVQLQHPSYCGGSSVLGNLCNAPEPAGSRPLIAVRDIGHLTMSVSDAVRSRTFYQAVFALDARGPQRSTTTLGIGSGGQFLKIASAEAATGAARGGGARGTIDHVCFNVERFDLGRAVKTLEGLGLSARKADRRARDPLQYFVTNPPANQGGAGTAKPELYFTDPDGILVQLQDPGDCSGREVSCE
jgi:catechol 2,3-dioxygenase-like lactoylglutathione lyase family enzyme